MKILYEADFPQNYIIRYPLQGALIIFAFTLIFTLVYRPLESHASLYFGYELTMSVYALITGISVYGLIKFLLKLDLFSQKKPWTLVKELSAILFLLFGLGIMIYFAAFIIEEPANRWNLPTLFNSMSNAFLIGILPFLFFTGLNYVLMKAPETSFGQYVKPEITSEKEELIHITSQLKKESLNLCPENLLYAESDGNYVNFYLLNQGKIQKKVIRNSITDIEQQLSIIPYMFRTHRAYIVNLKYVRSQKGNSLGYRLRLRGIEETEIPVSRKRSRHFSKIIKQVH